MSIYVVAAEGTTLVKIGCSVDVQFRITELRNWSPLPLSLLWVSSPEYHLRTEKQLHRLFAGRRQRGEWFDFGTEDAVGLVQSALRDLSPEPVKNRDCQLSRVKPAELAPVLGVLDAAAWWLCERGRDDWAEGFDPDEWRAEALRRHAAAGEVYLLTDDRAPLATMTVTGWADLDFAHGWPDGEPGNARYVVRLAVAHHGAGLGRVMLEHAVDIATATGVTWLRLDCAKNNPRLHSHYASRGFAHVNTVDLPHRRSGALFQRGLRPCWPAREST